MHELISIRQNSIPATGITFSFFLTDLIVLLLLAHPLLGQNDCEFQKEKDGIKVYTCPRVDSELNAIRASFEVNTTPRQYASIVLNVDDYQYWNYAATNPSLITRINETELIYYVEAKAPWPVTDRYAVLRISITQIPKFDGVKVTVQNVPERMPEKKGFVRVREYYSTLEIVPVASDKVKVSYFLQVDPGGKLPAWVVNLISTKFPINTFSNFKQRVKRLNDERAFDPVINF